MLRPSRRSAVRPDAPSAPRPGLSGDEPIVDRIELWTEAAARDVVAGVTPIFGSSPAGAAGPSPGSAAAG